MSKPPVLETLPSASFLRSFGGMVYDAFLIIAIEMLLLLIIGNLESFLLAEQLPDFIRLLVCYLVGAYFYIWAWTHGGKTLGMTAWRVEIRQFNGQPITPAQAWIRALSACLGIANIWKLVDKNNLGWHDYISGTVAVYDKQRSL